MLLPTFPTGCNVVPVGLGSLVSIATVTSISYNISMGTMMEAVVGVVALILIQVLCYMLLLFYSCIFTIANSSPHSFDYKLSHKENHKCGECYAYTVYVKQPNGKL